MGHTLISTPNDGESWFKVLHLFEAVLHSCCCRVLWQHNDAGLCISLVHFFGALAWHCELCLIAWCIGCASAYHWWADILLSRSIFVNAYQLCSILIDMYRPWCPKLICTSWDTLCFLSRCDVIHNAPQLKNSRQRGRTFPPDALGDRVTTAFGELALGNDVFIWPLFDSSWAFVSTSWESIKKIGSELAFLCCVLWLAMSFVMPCNAVICKASVTERTIVETAVASTTALMLQVLVAAVVVTVVATWNFAAALRNNHSAALRNNHSDIPCACCCCCCF